MKRTFLFSILIALWGLSSAWAEEAESGRQINVTTTATEQNGKMYFTSANLQFTPPCNKLRFTLTESGAFYSNGKKRMSFDSFELLKAPRWTSMQPGSQETTVRPMPTCSMA